MLGQILPLPLQPRAAPRQMSFEVTREFTEVVGVSSVPAYRPPYRLHGSYAFSSQLPRACYETMVFGDAKLYAELRRAVVRTFVVRIAVTLTATSLASASLTTLYLNYGGFYSNFFVLCLVFIIYIVSQFLVSVAWPSNLQWFLHYYRSTASKERYLELNKTDVRRFQTMQEVTYVTYTLGMPPPTYQVSTLDPPAYIDAPADPPADVLSRRISV